MLGFVLPQELNQTVNSVNIYVSVDIKQKMLSELIIDWTKQTEVHLHSKDFINMYGLLSLNHSRH